jgi:hypothetical protein
VGWQREERDRGRERERERARRVSERGGIERRGRMIERKGKRYLHEWAERGERERRERKRERE